MWLFEWEFPRIAACPQRRQSFFLQSAKIFFYEEDDRYLCLFVVQHHGSIGFHNTDAQCHLCIAGVLE